MLIAKNHTFRIFMRSAFEPLKILLVEIIKIYKKKNII